MLAATSLIKAGEPTAAVTPEGPDAAEVTLFPVPDYSSGLMTRSALTGDWGGARTSIAESGLQFSADVTQYYQGIFSGGLDDVSEYFGSADYRLKLDSGKLASGREDFLKSMASLIGAIRSTTSPVPSCQ